MTLHHVAKPAIAESSGAIAEAKAKIGKVVAGVLPRLFRCNFLPEVWIPDKKLAGSETDSRSRTGLFQWMRQKLASNLELNTQDHARIQRALTQLSDDNQQTGPYFLSRILLILLGLHLRLFGFDPARVGDFAVGRIAGAHGCDMSDPKLTKQNAATPNRVEACLLPG